MLAKLSVKKPYTVAVGVILVIVLGVISVMNMTTDLLPSMNLPYIVVYTPYVGASPEAVENTVTKPLEAALASVSELKSIASTSGDNVSVITLEFNDNASMDTAMLELNAKIDLVAPGWDDGVGTPTMIKVNPDMLPVVVASVDVEGLDIVALSDYVSDRLIGEMEGIDGVASVSAAGLIEEKVTVSIDQSLIDNVNSVILKEVDKELYKVEQKLLEGEEKLLDGKRRLDREGKQGLAQIAAALEQIRQARANLPQTIAGLQGQADQYRAQLDEAKAGKTQAEAALAQLPSPMTEAEKAALARLREAVSGYQAQIDEKKTALNAVLAQLSAIDPSAYPPVAAGMDGKEVTLDKALKNGGKILRKGEATPAPTAAPEKQTHKEVRFKGNVKKRIGKKSAEAVSTPAPQSAASYLTGWLLPAAFAEADGALEAELLAEKARLESEIAALQAQIDALEQSAAYRSLAQKEQIDAQRAAIMGQLAQANAAISQLESGIAMLQGYIAKLQSGIIPGGLVEGIDQDTSFDEAQRKLEEAQKTTKKMLADARAKINKAQKELGEGRREFEENREKAFEDAKLDGVITVPMISQIIAAQNLSMPAGYLTEDGQDYLVRVGDEFQDVDELRNTLLFTMDLDTLSEVRLGDVAVVEITNNAKDVYAKVNRNDGVLLSFSKQSTFSTAQVADNVLAKFSAMEAAHPGLRLTPLVDQGVYIDMIINSTLENLVWGGLLAILILLIFLGDYRPTLVVALSIPLSVVVALVAMYFTGITINVMSLAGLALGVGMLVDNSIVVIENIYRHHSDGMPILDACVTGTGQVASAITSSTLTTICVFLPLVFITGIAKQLFTDMGLTITYSLLASLLVAMTLVPAMCSWLLKRTKERKHRVFSAIQRFYRACLSLSLRVKIPVLLLVVVLLGYSGLRAVNMGTVFMSDVDSTQMTANLTFPLDFTKEQQHELTDRVMEKMLTVKDVQTVGVFGGGNAALSMITGGGSANSIAFYLNLSEDKTRRNTVIARDIQSAVAPLGCDLTIKTNNMDITTLYGSGISVDVKGPDLDILRGLATDIAGRLAQIEGVTDVSDGQEETVPEITLTVDKQTAVENGLTVAQIYQFVYQLVMDGVEVSTLTTGGKEYTVMAVEGKNLNLTREELSDRTIEVKKAEETIQVRLGDVCSIGETESLSSIRRSDQQHTISASCAVDADHNVGLVGRDVTAMLETVDLPEGYTAAISGESDTIASTLKDLALMILLAIVLIYLIMVAQFQSFLMPFIVLFTIPLAFTGGLLGLQLAGMELSMVGMLGFLILAGVIVNNGIVFVDSVNQMRLEGMGKREALLESGRIRLRPILMTAITTILGMSTMAAGNGMGSEMLQPMAVVTIGGMIYGTLLTLLVVPIMYDLLAPREMKARKIGKNKKAAEAALPPLDSDI